MNNKTASERVEEILASWKDKLYDSSLPNEPIIKLLKYYSDENCNNQLLESISKIDVKRDDELKQIVVYITTSRPGVLIGKAGKQIDEICAFFNKSIKPVYPITISIIECTLFKNVYKHDDNLEKYYK